MNREVDKIGDPEFVPVRVEFPSELLCDQINWTERSDRLYHELTRMIESNLSGVEVSLLSQSGHVAFIAVGWVSPDQAELALSCFEKVFPEAQSVLLGDSALESLNSKRGRVPRYNPEEFVYVPEKGVEFEDGSRQSVKPFWIGRCDVTVSQFSAFVDATGYVTTAEQQSDSRTFRDNDCLWALAPEEVKQAAAVCVSKLDAMAYCTWKSVRLPTEAQWLAAAVLDWNPLSDEEFTKALRHPHIRPNQLQIGNVDWLSNKDPLTNKSLCRSTPDCFLTQGWRKRSGPTLYDDDFYDLVLGFRVVKDV